MLTTRKYRFLKLIGPIMLLLIFFIIGTCIGSFINVVFYRLPLMMQLEKMPQDSPFSSTPFNLITPGSHCPTCGQTLGILQLIPLLSWVKQRGCCHNCAAPISIRYPLIELATGLLFVVIIGCWQAPLFSLTLSMFASALLVLALIDQRYMLLPDAITLPLLWCGLIWNGSGLGLVTLESAVWGAVAGYLSLWSTYWLYRLIRKREGLGYGDFKLMGALGAWLGVNSINTILLLGPIIAALYWFIRRAHLQKTTMAFGPALSAAAIIWLLSQSPLLLSYFLPIHIN